MLSHCLCGELEPPTPSDPEVVVIRHHWEARKTTGTARLAGLLISNLRIIDMAEDPAPVRAQLRALEGAWFLYPGGEASGQPVARPKTLVLLDGTWRQTRKMLRRLPELSLLPCFSLAETAVQLSRSRLREPPRPGARSTLEAIADALSQLESADRGRQLLEVHGRFVEQTLRSRGSPRLAWPRD